MIRNRKAIPITQCYGFTEDEVKQLCERYDMDFDTVKAWYNGYLIDGMHMYNPNSVSLAMEYQKIDSYWKNTSSFSAINTYITMNYAGLKDDVLSMLSGGNVRVNVDTFQNDLVTMRSKDEVLTALIHLGYIAFDLESKKAFILRSNAGNRPAMIVELKYDKSADAAINQIREKIYR